MKGLPKDSARRQMIKARRAIRTALYDKWVQQYGPVLSYDDWHHPAKREAIEKGKR